MRLVQKLKAESRTCIFISNYKSTKQRLLLIRFYFEMDTIRRQAIMILMLHKGEDCLLVKWIQVSSIPNQTTIKAHLSISLVQGDFQLMSTSGVYIVFIIHLQSKTVVLTFFISTPLQARFQLSHSESHVHLQHNEVSVCMYGLMYI